MIDDARYGGLIDKYLIRKAIFMSIILIILSIMLTGCGYHNDYKIYTNLTHNECLVQCSDFAQSRICSSQSVGYNDYTHECDCVMFECLKDCEECMK